MSAPGGAKPTARHVARPSCNLQAVRLFSSSASGPEVLPLSQLQRDLVDDALMGDPHIGSTTAAMSVQECVAVQQALTEISTLSKWRESASTAEGSSDSLAAEAMSTLVASSPESGLGPSATADLEAILPPGVKWRAARAVRSLAKLHRLGALDLAKEMVESWAPGQHLESTKRCAAALDQLAPIIKEKVAEEKERQDRLARKEKERHERQAREDKEWQDALTALLNAENEDREAVAKAGLSELDLQLQVLVPDDQVETLRRLACPAVLGQLGSPTPEPPLDNDALTSVACMLSSMPAHEAIFLLVTGTRDPEGQGRVTSEAAAVPVPDQRPAADAAAGSEASAPRGGASGKQGRKLVFPGKARAATIRKLSHDAARVLGRNSEFGEQASYFVGPRGSGKTLLAGCIAEALVALAEAHDLARGSGLLQSEKHLGPPGVKLAAVVVGRPRQNATKPASGSASGAAAKPLCDAGAPEAPAANDHRIFVRRSNPVNSSWASLCAALWRGSQHAKLLPEPTVASQKPGESDDDFSQRHHQEHLRSGLSLMHDFRKSKPNLRYVLDALSPDARVLLVADEAQDYYVSAESAAEFCDDVMLLLADARRVKLVMMSRSSTLPFLIKGPRSAGLVGEIPELSEAVRHGACRDLNETKVVQRPPLGLPRPSEMADFLEHAAGTGQFSEELTARAREPDVAKRMTLLQQVKVETPRTLAESDGFAVKALPSCSRDDALDWACTEDAKAQAAAASDCPGNLAIDSFHELIAVATMRRMRRKVGPWPSTREGVRDLAISVVADNTAWTAVGIANEARLYVDQALKASAPGAPGRAWLEQLRDEADTWSGPRFPRSSTVSRLAAWVDRGLIMSGAADDASLSQGSKLRSPAGWIAHRMQHGFVGLSPVTMAAMGAIGDTQFNSVMEALIGHTVCTASPARLAAAIKTTRLDVGLPAEATEAVEAELLDLEPQWQAENQSAALDFGVPDDLPEVQVWQAHAAMPRPVSVEEMRASLEQAQAASPGGSDGSSPLVWRTSLDTASCDASLRRSLGSSVVSVDVQIKQQVDPAGPRRMSVRAAAEIAGSIKAAHYRKQWDGCDDGTGGESAAYRLAKALGLPTESAAHASFHGTVVFGRLPAPRTSTSTGAMAILGTVEEAPLHNGPAASVVRNHCFVLNQRGLAELWPGPVVLFASMMGMSRFLDGHDDRR